MPTVQPQTQNNAFRAETNAYLYPAPRQTAGSPKRAVPPPVSQPVPPRKAQKAPVALMLAVATLLLLVGLAYLYGHALVTQEGYRHARLRAMLLQESELARQMEHQQTLMQSPSQIEHQARSIGMVPADDKQTLTVGDISANQ